MKVFTASFSGVYLSGDAVVVAETQRKAYNALRKQLKAEGLDLRNADLKVTDLYEVDTTKPSVDILDNGDY